MSAPADTSRPLEGKDVVLVEDEALVAMYVEDLLFDLGAARVEIASSVGTAFALLDKALPQLAVLDLNLGGQASYPVARRLESTATPFFFLTGYGIDGVDPAWRRHPIVEKPASLDALRKAVCAVLR
ncbi:MAG: response regulator [Rhodospirillaceae bacterium]